MHWTLCTFVDVHRVYSRSAMVVRVISTLAGSFVCSDEWLRQWGIVEPYKELSFFDQIEFVESFCYLVAA